MILETVLLHVISGKEKQFEHDFETAGIYISSAKGYISHSLGKCIEEKHKYILLVKWETMDDHITGFRQSESYTSWKKLLHHYYDPFPAVEHYKIILENKKTT